MLAVVAGHFFHISLCIHMVFFCRTVCLLACVFEDLPAMRYPAPTTRLATRGAGWRCLTVRALHSGSFKAQQVAQNCLYFLVSSSHLEVGNDSLQNLQLVKFCLITLTFLGGEVGISSLESLFLLLFLATVFYTCTVICAGFSAFSGAGSVS